MNESSFAWSGDAAGAVSLTYDDGEPDNLHHAIPDLEEAGFRGTFYLCKVGPAVERIEEWRAAFQNGHEIGCVSRMIDAVLVMLQDLWENGKEDQRSTPC